MEFLSLISLIIWVFILFLPWRPYSTKEVLDSEEEDRDIDLSDVTVLIPARNEAKVIKDTLEALKDQGKGLKIILIDDESEDGTSERAKEVQIKGLKIIKGKPLPEGWAGKIWALEQGFKFVNTPFTLLMDADIFMKKGIVGRLRRKTIEEDLDMVSLMARLSMENIWEKILIPSFVYFFKLLYPFSLCNKERFPVAAAAGGCIFVKTEAIKEIGGFKSIRNEIIDDCALAKRIKKRGYRIWIGLTHSVISRRRYSRLSEIWNMVARSAFTQLRYSILLLILCTLALLFAFVFPFFGLFSGSIKGFIISLATFISMWLTYIPILDFYSLKRVWAFALPIAGILYLLMTWTSAIRYFSGKRSIWKGRTYSSHNIS